MAMGTILSGFNLNNTVVSSYWLSAVKLHNDATMNYYKLHSN